MIELFDAAGNYEGRIVPSPIIYPGMEPVKDWGIFHAAAGGKLECLNRAPGPLNELRERAKRILASGSN